jgi:hypothetical protein
MNKSYGAYSKGTEMYSLLSGMAKYAYIAPGSLAMPRTGVEVVPVIIGGESLVSCPGNTFT